MDQNSNAVLSGLARHINCLGEDNKIARRKALENIRKDTSGQKPPLNESELKPVLNELLKPLLKEFSDPAEKCREIALDILKYCLKQVKSPEDYLPYIIPVIVQRIGQPDMIEPSEELRLEMVDFLLEILEHSGKNISVYLDDVIKILQRTLLDPFADVKKKSCQCSSVLAKAIPEYFIQQSESLIKPLCMAISHQHSKVRSLVVYTIGDVIQYGHGKSVDDVVSHLAQRLFDQAPAVRMAVTKVVGGWMLDLMDRYSFWHKLIPLLLTSLSDEQPEIQEVADSLWHDIGLKYASENETDLKDKQDFPTAEPTHYPKGVERPNLGCRTLLFRNMSKILPALMRDVTDWVVGTRQASARLLYHVLLNGEEYITQHMELLTSGMYRGCADEEPTVVRDIQKAAELIGYFVPIDVWSKLILKSIETQQSYVNLMVLSSVVRGAERKTLTTYLKPILNAVSNPEVCQSVQVAVQVQLLSVLESLMSVCESDVTSDTGVKQTMFNLLHTVMALNQGETILEKVHELLTTLARLDGLDDRKLLYKTLTRPLLETFGDTYEVWTTHSTERLVFDALIMEAGPVVGELLDLIVPILAANLNPDRDVAVRLKFFTLLSHLVMNCKDTLDSENKFSDFSVGVVRDMIIPNCVWKAGRTESGIRTMAVSTAWTLLQSGILTKEKLEPVLDKFVTQMLSSMDDDNKSTRLVACRVMTRTFELAGPALDQDRLHNMYLELIKRLDDSNDEIRVTVTKTFLAYLDCFTKEYNTSLYQAHLEAIYKGLLIHLDDPDERIQTAVLAVLKKAGALLPGMLLQEVETSKHKHRSKRYCDELTEHLQKLNTTS